MFTHFIVSASAFTLASFVTLWAQAAPLSCEERAIVAYDAACVDGECGPVADAAYEDATFVCEFADPAVNADFSDYNRAIAQADDAPAYCLSVWVQRDVSRNWITICDLLGTGE